MFQQIHAIDAMHPNIEKDAARCQSVHLFEKLGAAFKKHRLKPGHLQNETKALTNLIIIINHIYVTRHDHRSEEQTSELQSLIRISYDVFCLQTKQIHSHYKNKNNNYVHTKQI